MTQREAFEKWAKSSGMDLTLLHPGSIYYKDDRTHWAWHGWQAATQEPPKMVLDLSRVERDDAVVFGPTNKREELRRYRVESLLAAIRTQLPTVEIITEMKETNK